MCSIWEGHLLYLFYKEVKSWDSTTWFTIRNFKPRLKSSIFKCRCWLKSTFSEGDDQVLLKERVEAYLMAPMLPPNSPTIFFCLQIYSLQLQVIQQYVRLSQTCNGRWLETFSCQRTVTEVTRRRKPRRRWNPLPQLPSTVVASSAEANKWQRKKLFVYIKDVLILTVYCTPKCTPQLWVPPKLP